MVVAEQMRTGEPCSEQHLFYRLELGIKCDDFFQMLRDLPAHAKCSVNMGCHSWPKTDFQQEDKGCAQANKGAAIKDSRAIAKGSHRS